ncbi:outer membrane beta-barrel protein [Tamlana sp. s12]|uniref:outer membrane beta-barrel protein n=1 Tax=Tamlana sp. s12 TaxID=1630406 RepID=UPI000800A3FF|nr:outer membrane beta-barrel protein [Tamlana sp. s12]OBQ52258.1 hypothetical protein VQ01_14330 [Tamlana sp. s12]QQY82362.1 outer membrane beta-barrel protein [Tamlana sp. s12]
MKKRIIGTALALFVFGFANAQKIPDAEITQAQVKEELNSAKGITFQKGDIFVEGSISVTSNDLESTYAINPKVGYFLSSKFAVGADMDFGGEKDKISDEKSTIFGIGGFGRYYFLELDKKRLKSYGELGLGYGHSEGTSTSNDIKANITIGLNYFLTKNIAVTFELADILSYNNANPEDSDAASSFELNVNLFNNPFAQPKFGLLYKF